MHIRGQRDLHRVWRELLWQLETRKEGTEPQGEMGTGVIET